MFSFIIRKSLIRAGREASRRREIIAMVTATFQSSGKVRNIFFSHFHERNFSSRRPSCTRDSTFEIIDIFRTGCSALLDEPPGRVERSVEVGPNEMEMPAGSRLRCAAAGESACLRCIRAESLVFSYRDDQRSRRKVATSVHHSQSDRRDRHFSY